MKLTLVNFQSEEEIDFDPDNPIIIGRGPLFGCFDKKVSRNHGQVELTPDGNVHLIALHSNPCFVMKNGVPPVIQLTKNEKKILNDGDYIGLLPDSFWYKVVVHKDENSIICNNLVSNLKADTEPEKNSGLEETIITSDDANKHSNGPQTTTSERKNHIAPVTDVDKNATNKVNSNESLEERLKALEHTKKLPLFMYEIDIFPEECCTKNAEETLSNDMEEVKEKFVEDNAEEKEDCKSTGTTTFIKSEDNPQSHGQFTVTNTKDSREDLNSCEVSVNINVSVKENVPHTSNKITENQKKESSDAVSDSPGFNKRPFCQYEGSCYRKNEEHKRDFCHPGDPDFLPYESRPVCQFGSSCYRQNKNHRVQYQHPKKKSPVTRVSKDSPKGKRRKKQTSYRDTSYEDEYDLEDPFINDGSSDEFIPSDFSSDEEM